MNKLDITKYHLLSTNIEVLNLSMEIEERDLKLKLRIKAIQKDCPHKNCDKGTKTTYEDGERFEKLLTKSCSDCGFEFEKPKGMPWTVCEACWGEMKDNGQVQQQDYREHHFKCKSCGHTTYYT